MPEMNDIQLRPTMPMPPSQAAAIAAGAQNSDKAEDKTQGNFFTRHRHFTKEPVSYTGYQFFRSAIATIPYGLGMAFFHHVFGLMSVAGERMGLTEKGQQKFTEIFTTRDPKTGMSGGIGKAGEIIDTLEKKAIEEFHAPGIKGKIGRNMVRFANSPLNAAMQIGLAFSMFRFTGGLIKTVRDKVMDEKNTDEDTVRETKSWWQTVKDAAKVNWKAEAIGTFWAALTLGYIGATFKQSTPYLRQQLPGGGKEPFLTAVKRVWSPASKLLQNAAIWAISYSAFFEVDERLQKDVKLREGTWSGHANSLINGPSEVSGKPPADRKDAQGNTAPQEHHWYNFFTDDPGIPRLLFRRVLPVAVGIGGYAVMKRAGYVIGGGQMRPITQEVAKRGVGGNMKMFLGNARREGLATATFGVLWLATDAWGSWYDKFFEKMHNKGQQQPMTEHQAHNHVALLDKLNEKEQSSGRAA